MHLHTRRLSQCFIFPYPVSMHENQTNLIRGNPWIFVPVLFFLQGVPYFVVNAIAVTIFNKLGVPNDSLLFWISLVALLVIINIGWFIYMKKKK